MLGGWWAGFKLRHWRRFPWWVQHVLAFPDPGTVPSPYGQMSDEWVERMNGMRR